MKWGRPEIRCYIKVSEVCFLFFLFFFLISESFTTWNEEKHQEYHQNRDPPPALTHTVWQIFWTHYHANSYEWGELVKIIFKAQEPNSDMTVSWAQVKTQEQNRLSRGLHINQNPSHSAAYGADFSRLITDSEVNQSKRPLFCQSLHFSGYQRQHETPEQKAAAGDKLQELKWNPNLNPLAKIQPRLCFNMLCARTGKEWHETGWKRAVNMQWRATCWNQTQATVAWTWPLYLEHTLSPLSYQGPQWYMFICFFFPLEDSSIN